LISKQLVLSSTALRTIVERAIWMDIIEIFYASGNEEKAVSMTSYMKSKFPFLGIQKPERARLSRDFLKQKRKEGEIDWGFIFGCYGMPEREFHYLALDYIESVKSLLLCEDIAKIESLIMTNSWWDSVDFIDGIVGDMCIKYPELRKSFVDKWIESDNIWLKRVSIDFQLKYKENTDTDILSKAILRNSVTKEFFVDKAIGWALREYSKTNKEWVAKFLKSNELSRLSVREASKYI
jgi:3-methyladenine DNA glycosylase AlkD